MIDNRNAVIYALCEPDGETIRYIGKTLEGREHRRFKRHLHDKVVTPTRKTNWIASLKNRGLRPVMKVLAVVPRDKWDYWEVFHIRQCIDAGCDLTNSDGGGWGPDKWNDEALERLRTSMNAPSYLAKVSGDNHFSKRNPEAMANHRAAVASEEYRAQFRGENNPMNKPGVREVQLAAVRTPEQREIRRQNMKNLNSRPDVVANKIAALRLRSSVFRVTNPNGEVKQFVGNDAGCDFFKVSGPTWLAAVKRGERDGWKIERLGTVAELGLSV